MCIFMISLIFFGMFSYFIFWDQNRTKPWFNHHSKRKNNEVTIISVGLFWLISSLVLLILIEYKDKIFNVLFGNCSHKDFMIDSGFCFSIMLVIAGFIIRSVFFVLCKINETRKRKFIDFLTPKEQTLIFVLSCILLSAIGFKEKDYFFAYFIIALIIGKFFWLDSTISIFKEIIKDIKDLEEGVVLIFIGSIYFIVIALFSEIHIYACIIGSALGFILGILPHAYKKN